MTTRLAIPLFGDEVAPRFCVADELLLADVVEGAIDSRRRVSVAGVAWPGRLRRLADRGVTVLLCGGFNRGFMPLALRLGIEVRWGLAGRVDQLMDAYCRGEIERFVLCPRRGRRGASPRSPGRRGPPAAVRGPWRRGGPR